MIKNRIAILLTLLCLLPAAVYASLNVQSASRQAGSAASPHAAVFPEVIFAGTSQKVAFTGTSAASTQLQSTTSVVRLVCDAACFVAFGATAPTAVATGASMFIPANVPILVGVAPSSYIAAIEVSSGGNLWITEGG